MRIGHLVKKLRLANNWSQIEAAKKVNLSQSYYNEIESGKAKCPLDTLTKICKGFGMDLPTFFSMEELYEDSDDLKIIKKNDLDSLLSEIGIDYIVLAKEFKDKNISPDAVKKIIDAFTSNDK